MNGQPARQVLVRNLAEGLRGVQLVIETGSFRGLSTGFLHKAFNCQVWTVENNRRWYAHTRARFALNPRIHVNHGDSRDQLRRFAQKTDRNLDVFAYLDAHWEEDLPLQEELAILVSTWRRLVIMIDDFEVPDDPGYGFDDYGPGKALNANYLADSAAADWPVLYPAIPSTEEGGPKRGCCVVVSPSLASLKLRGVRPAKAS